MKLLIKKFKLLLGVSLIIGVTFNTVAQTVKSPGQNALPAVARPNNAAPNSTSVKPAVTSSQPNQVDSVKIEGDTSASGKTKPLRVELNTRIVLYMSGPTKRFEHQDSVAIYINNQKMPYKVNFNCPCLDTIKHKNTFTLTCTLGKHDTSWNKLYGFKNNYLDVKVDAGTLNKQITCTTVNNLSIKMFNKRSLTVAWAVVVALVVVSILLAFVFKTELIRDHSSLEKTEDKPYSLSRFQLLWWTVIIISCYMLLFAIRDDFGLLSQSTLILLGISAAGTGFAAAVDYSDNDKDRHQNIKGDGFIIDILSDNDGISVHRFQNVVFTIIFGMVFVYKVLATGNMPDFGELELALMGLSTATYVGLKTGENKNQGPAPSINSIPTNKSTTT